MTTLAKNRYRFNPVAGFPFNWQEQQSNKTLEFPSGVDLQIEVALREEGTTYYDCSTVTSLTLEVKALAAGEAPDAGAATLMTKTVTVLDANTVTDTAYRARTAQHATFVFSDDATNLAAADYWAVLSAVLSDGSITSIAWGKIKVIEDGTGPTAVPDPLDPSYVTAASLTTTLSAYTSKSIHRPVAPLIYIGDATAAQVFGYFYAPIAEQIVEMQAFAQVAPTGAAITIELYKNAVATGEVLTIADGASNGRLLLSAAITLAVADVLTAKILTVGSTEPGGYLTLNLVRQPA